MLIDCYHFGEYKLYNVEHLLLKPQKNWFSYIRKLL